MSILNNRISTLAYIEALADYCAEYDIQANGIRLQVPRAQPLQVSLLAFFYIPIFCLLAAMLLYPVAMLALGQKIEPLTLYQLAGASIVLGCSLFLTMMLQVMTSQLLAQPVGKDMAAYLSALRADSTVHFSAQSRDLIDSGQLTFGDLEGILYERAYELRHLYDDFYAII